MPQIEKSKNLRPVVKKATGKKTKPKQVKHTPIEYYTCLLTQAQQGWRDPQSGKRKKITTCCKECKLNAPLLTSQRTEQIHKLITAYKQVGDSLTELLRPIK